jgi:hypothetical protein
MEWIDNDGETFKMATADSVGWDREKSATVASVPTSKILDFLNVLGDLALIDSGFAEVFKGSDA